ncbi:MAG: class I SAM-dependent methyltransferase [Planctomycetaceae bacterium]
MNRDSDYELIDFGGGRKLESLSGYVIDRPSPAALNSSKVCPELWGDASARFDEHQQRWTFDRAWPSDLYIAGEGFRLPLRATPFGHIGAFPEQRRNWQWLARTAARLRAYRGEPEEGRSPLQAMNLFAHTGGSTLALAAAEVAVVHLDAAKPNVAAAREAALCSGLDKAAIRYIVDDASRFAARELRRQREYDIIVMDPPAYGHALGGKTWRIQRDLWPLLDQSCRLMNMRLGAMLVTGHTEGIDQQTVSQYLSQQSPLRAIRDHLRISAGRSFLTDRSGRKLDAGFYVRVDWHS